MVDGVHDLDSGLELDELGPWEGARVPAPEVAAGKPASAPLVLASWRNLVDGSASNAGATQLLASARPAVVRLSAATAKDAGVQAGESVTVAAGSHTVTLPAVVEPDMVDGVAWVPGNFFTGSIGELGVLPGDAVTLTRGGAQ